MGVKPTVFPEWDTTWANMVEPLSGEKATGWALDATIVSSYFNWWMHQVWQLLAFSHGTRWRWAVPNVGGAHSHYALNNTAYTNGTTHYDGGGGSGGEYGVVNMSIDSLEIMPVEIPVGEIVFAMGIWYKGAASGSSTLTLVRKNLTTGVTGIVDTITLASQAGYTKVTHTLAVPEPVADDFAYWYTINGFSFSDTIHVRAVGFLRGDFNQ